MAKFRIRPHGRLQEWVAEEKGLFRAEGLDYAFGFDHLMSDVTKANTVQREGQAVPDIMAGAFEAYRAGKGNKGEEEACDISSACHWTVNQAAHVEYGTMYRNAYSVADAGLFVAPESEVKTAADMAGREVAVGYHSGSHYSALQALEVFHAPESINLKFAGTPWTRVELALERKVAAANVWGAQRYVLEQQGFRKIADTSFMIGFMFPATADEDDIAKYIRALRRAQAEIDFRPEPYKHYFENEIPERFAGLYDTRLFGPGERIVFLPYTREMFEATQAWMHSRNLFEGGAEVGVDYEVAVRG